MISLGIDIGGTGCKCAAFTDQGQQLSVCYREYGVQAGGVNLPPKKLWEAVESVVRGCVRALEDPAEVAVVSVSSFGESYVAIDADGEPIEDIRMYYGNSKNIKFDGLVERIGARRFMEICRILPDACYSLAKMLYTMDETEKRVDCFLFIAGYIGYCLCGAKVTDPSLACRSLLYDVENGCWSKEILSAVGIEENQLPAVAQSGTDLGTILPDVADRLGLPETVHVAVGCQDQIANALGAGVASVGDAVDTSGTCECITPLFGSIPQSLDLQKNNFACIPYLCGKGYVTYAYNISAGSVVKWYRDALAYHLKQDGRSIYDVLNETAPSEPTDLFVLPFLQGMGGTPEVDAEATGVIAGLTTKTRLPDIYRAILEGITYEMRYNQEKLGENGIVFKKLYACGGGARSRVWLQIKADILGCPIVPILTEETGALGSAILGLSAMTGESPIDIAGRFVQRGASIEPDPRRRELYEKRYTKYRKLRSMYKEL